MKIAEFYCDLCGKKVEGEANHTENVVLNNILSSMGSKKSLDLYVCDDCVEELKNRAEKTKERITKGEREVAEELKEAQEHKEKVLNALKVLHDNYEKNHVMCDGIMCVGDMCPFSIYDNCQLHESPGEVCNTRKEMFEEIIQKEDKTKDFFIRNGKKD